MERERFLGRVAAALRGAELPEIALTMVPPEIRFDTIEHSAGVERIEQARIKTR